MPSPQQLLDEIRLGESSALEFKEVRFAGGKIRDPKRDALGDGLAAFANAQGGLVVLGVEDSTREVLGIPVERVEAVMDYVREICTDAIKPALEHFALERLRLPDRAGVERVVVTIEVPRSLFVHESASGYFHRVGNAKRRMSPEYLARLFQQRSQTRLIRFDEQVVGGARCSDLSARLWERFKTVRSDEDSETFLRKLGLAAEDENGEVRPTVAGVLVASEQGRRWLPNAYVQAVAYRGTAIRLETKDEPYQLDAADIEGPLDRQVVEACHFVVKNMRTAAIKDQGRIDRSQYDMQAVFEALVNAVAHRDYSIHGSKIRLRLFENRLEVYSPGAIANTLEVDSLRYRQSARNEAICSLLSKCIVPDEPWLANGRRHMMERRGEGVPIILDNSERLSGEEPEYRLIDDAELLLTIHAAKVVRSSE